MSAAAAASDPQRAHSVGGADRAPPVAAGRIWQQIAADSIMPYSRDVGNLVALARRIAAEAPPARVGRSPFDPPPGEELPEPFRAMAQDFDAALAALTAADFALQVPEDTLHPDDAVLETAREAVLFPKTRSNMAYLPVVDDADVSIGVFLLPPGSFIPLHDHPGMHVFSKTLYGSFYTVEMDQVDEGRARVVDEHVRTSQSPMAVVRADYGNLHAIYAYSTCAFVDVILPPYENGVRECTYYKITDASAWPNVALRTDAADEFACEPLEPLSATM